MIPVIIMIIYLKGYYDKFVGEGPTVLAGWMAVAVLLLGFVLYCAFTKKKSRVNRGTEVFLKTSVP